MKSKNIPEDLKLKSIKESQKEIKDIINNLENDDTNLEGSINKYNRMMQLNNHIKKMFKKKLIEIRRQNFKDNKKKLR